MDPKATSPVKRVVKPRGGRPRKYPFATLDVGQSFFVKNRTRAEMAGSIAHAKKVHGHEYTTQQGIASINGREYAGTWIWRVK